MAGELQPLDQKFAIVDTQGRPTEYFTRWAQQKQIDIGDSITLADLQDFLTAHKLAAGHGIILTPDGNLNDSPSVSVANGTGLNFDTMGNLKLADTAVVPGTYGDATHVPAIVVDQQGRITGVTLVAISGGGGGGAMSLIGRTAFGTISSASPVIITGLDTVNKDYVLRVRLNRPSAGAVASDALRFQFGDTTLPTPVWLTDTHFVSISGSNTGGLGTTAGVTKIAQVQNATTFLMMSELNCMWDDAGKAFSAFSHSANWENYQQIDCNGSVQIGAIKLSTVNQAWSGSYSLYSIQKT